MTPPSPDDPAGMPPGQPTPQVDESDVERIVRRDFPEPVRKAVLRTLRRLYAPKPDLSRTKLAALKIANGDLRLLERAVDGGGADFRDLLMEAEYPACRDVGLVLGRQLTREQWLRIYDEDWKQYEAWLRRP